MSGASNTIADSYIAHSWGDCISVWGTNNSVSNCVIEDADWSGTDTAPIATTGTGHSIKNCTIRLGGRDIIVHRGLAGGLIASNILSDGGILTHDNGLTYTDVDPTTPATEIAYNWCHDNHATGDGVGIYIDNNSANKIVDHNVIWRCSRVGIFLNCWTSNNIVYNNTIWDCYENIYGGDSAQSFNIFLWNNIGSGLTYWNGDPSFGNVTSNNLVSPGRPFSEFLSGKTISAPRLGSPIIDSGVQISGMPDFLGTAPDLGAYEYNSQTNHWVPGANFAAPLFPDTVPLVPEDVQVTALTPYSCNISWNASEGVQSYFVESSPDAQNWKLAATVLNETSCVVNTSLAPGSTNFYRITASSSVGRSISSNPTFAMTPSDGSFTFRLQS